MTIQSGNQVFASAQEFMDHLEAEWAASPRLERAKVVAKRHWRTFVRLRHEPGYAWQRARRGFSERDTWGFDHHLAVVIVGAVTQLRDRGIGHPGWLTAEEWDKIQTQIIRGFSIYRDVDHYDRTPKQHQRVQQAKELLMLYFEDLWD